MDTDFILDNTGGEVQALLNQIRTNKERIETEIRRAKLQEGLILEKIELLKKIARKTEIEICHLKRKDKQIFDRIKELDKKIEKLISHCCNGDVPSDPSEPDEPSDPGNPSDPEEYDLYIGGGSSWSDVVNDGNRIKSDANIYKEYSVTIKNDGDLMFVVLPIAFNGKIGNITMSDFKIPMEVVTTGEYLIYKSLNQYRAGTYPIKIVK